MSKKREKMNKKSAKKHSIYDNIAVSERTLSILIVFGIIAAALAITCGYFMGNGSSSSNPSAIKAYENEIYVISRSLAEEWDFR